VRARAAPVGAWPQLFVPSAFRGPVSKQAKRPSEWANGNRNTAVNAFGNGNTVRAGTGFPNAKPAFNIAAVFGKNNQVANNEIK
jgi:hypothetical protein